MGADSAGSRTPSPQDPRASASPAPGRQEQTSDRTATTLSLLKDKECQDVGNKISKKMSCSVSKASFQSELPHMIALKLVAHSASSFWAFVTQAGAQRGNSIWRESTGPPSLNIPGEDAHEPGIPGGQEPAQRALGTHKPPPHTHANMPPSPLPGSFLLSPTWRKENHTQPAAPATTVPGAPRG